MSDASPSSATRPAPAAAGGGGPGLRGLLLAIAVAGLLVGTVAAVLGSLAAFERTLMTTVQSRLSEVATEVARNIENGLQAGVVLEQQRRLLAVLADERTQAPDLSAIRVNDERGRILFSTNEAEIGEAAPLAAAEMPNGDAPAQWFRADGARISLGLRLTGLFGEPLGSVTVTLPADTVDDQRARYAISLALGAVAIVAAGALLAALLLALLPLPGAARLEGLRRRLDTLYERAGLARPQPSAAPDPAQPAALPDSLARFEAWLDRRVGSLGEREAEVRRLDETA